MPVTDPLAVPGPAGFAGQWLGQRIVFADGGLGRLADEVSALGATAVVLVASQRGDLPARVAGLLGGRLAGQWADVRQHVPAEVAAGLVARSREVGADLLVSVGGGSALGLAKIAARDAGLPVLAIPTTYAGSEMTPVWGITEGTAKRTGRDLRVLPRTVIYDPALLAALPPRLAGVSGMNALAHCVEALYAPLADPLTSLGALEGARLIATVLPAACRPGEESARRGLLWASCLAGRSFGTAGGSLHHGICHLLGGSAGLPHAQTHAIVLPHAVAFLGPAISPALARLAVALAADPADVPGAIWDLGRRVGTPHGLRALGLAERALPALAEALVTAGPASPRPLDRPAVLALLTAAWSGDRPASEAVLKG